MIDSFFLFLNSPEHKTKKICVGVNQPYLALENIPCFQYDFKCGFKTRSSGGHLHSKKPGNTSNADMLEDQFCAFPFQFSRN